VAPVIADNLFPHTQAQAVTGQDWETDVQLPAELGMATLQVIEFMTPHAPGCFYHHCAQLELVPADAGIDDGGVVDIPDAAGASDAASRDIDSGGGAAFGPSSQTPAASSGCSVGAFATNGFAAVGALGIVVLWGVRRRRMS
jgi:hypothetical protein